MAVSLARSVERSRRAGSLLPPASPLLGLAFERRASVPGSRRGVAQKRSASADVIPGIGRARHGLPPGQWKERAVMAVVTIGVDPHKGSHTAVAINAAEQPLGQLRVRASAVQAERLLEWAQAWPERAWAVEGAGGTGHLLAQQLLAAGEQVLDVPPKLAARVRLLATGNINKNDPNDARSVAVAALRSANVRQARQDDHATVLKVWSKRYEDLGRVRTQVACRLHQVLCELVPGGVAREITAGQAGQILASITPAGAVDAARWELAAELTEDLRGVDIQIRETRKKAAAAVRASGTSLTGLFGVGSIIAAAVIGDVRVVSRFPDRDHSDPLPAQPGPCLLRQETGRGQNPQRSPARTETADQRRHLRLPASRRPARCSRPGQEPGRATGEPLCIQGGQLTPRPPALRTSHSRACHPPYDPGRRPRPRVFSRSAAISRERAAGSRTGQSPAAQRRPQASLTRPPASRQSPRRGKSIDFVTKRCSFCRGCMVLPSASG